jgi:hypothetical protein
MVKDQNRLEVRTQWFPTQQSGERSLTLQLESVLNQPGAQDESSMAETAWSTGDIQQALADLLPVGPARVRRELQRLLQPWPQRRYAAAYGRSGGILNLFTPPWDEKQDEVWHRLRTAWKARNFADEKSRRAALAEVEQQWNETAHPFFAGLTPAHVMVGGGPQEAKLANEFLSLAERRLGKGDYQGDGEALIKTLMLLRGWQVQPQRDGRTPMQIILAERNELLARRKRALVARKL